MAAKILGDRVNVCSVRTRMGANRVQDSKARPRKYCCVCSSQLMKKMVVVCYDAFVDL